MISKQNKYKLISVLEHKNYKIVGDSLFVFADNVNMLSSLIKISNRFGIKIIPIGYGSTYSEGYKPSENSVFLSSQRLNQIISIDKNDSFAEIESGCDWLGVFGNLKSENLFFPIELESVKEKRTAGGIFSTLRPDSAASNYFTGIEFIAPDGTQIKYGSKTLKNVSGYDIIKFMTGTFGSFGFITSFTVRLIKSEKDYFRHEKLKDICSEKTDFGSSERYKNLKSVMDPNSVFE